MNKTFKYFGLFLSLVLTGALTGCQVKELSEATNLGLGIKVFSPTKVVAGQPMTINGSGFTGAKEIVFPNGVSVTDFEIVSNDMIRVTAPSGIAAEGGRIYVSNATDKVESALALSIGKTVVSGYSKQEGETATGGELITIYGTDLEFIDAVELLDSDGKPNVISHENFYRKGTGNVIFYVPRTNIYDGSFVGKVHTFDGQTFPMPELKYEPYKGGGHWEVKKTILWQNDGTHGPVSWNGDYRFANVNSSSGEEIHAFSMEEWAVIKDGTFCLAVDCGGSPNIRVTTGWWTGAYGGNEHNCADMLQEDESGNKFLELNIKEDGNLYENIDVQHLLFTGDQYTPVAIYTEELIWVEEEEGHWERKSLWKNDGTHGDISWNGTYRFSNVESSSGEEVHAFSMEEWAVIKDGKFRVALDCSGSSNIRITTGWWSGAYGGNEHNCLDMVQEEEDGTKYIELNIKEDGNLYDIIDVQHLLFTGDQYTIAEIYVKVWVPGGSSKKKVMIWENPDPAGLGAVSWNGTYRFSNAEATSGEEIYAIPMDQWQIIKEGEFYFVYDGNEGSNVRITTGWWSGAYGGNDHNCIDMAEDDPDTGKKVIKLNIKEDGNLYDSIDVQHLLFTGDAYTPLKLYYVE